MEAFTFDCPTFTGCKSIIEVVQLSSAQSIVKFCRCSHLKQQKYPEEPLHLHYSTNSRRLNKHQVKSTEKFDNCYRLISECYARAESC
jgi:hypothetical protein